MEGLALEQKVRRPRKGKLLGRLNFHTGLFYKEFVPLSQEFISALSSHLTPLRGRLVALLEATEVKRETVKSYMNGKSNKKATDGAGLIPMENYRAIAAYLNSEGEGRLEPNPQPDKVSGMYVGMLLAWYFDKVDERTKELSSNMYKATDILLARMAEADEGIAAKWLGAGKEKHAALLCTARDLLTGRKGLIRYSALSPFEIAVIGSLGISGIAIPQQLREAFRGADLSNLEASLESRLADFADKVRRDHPKEYWYRNGFTPPSVDYFEGDLIMHPLFGLGKVVATEANATKITMKQPMPGKYGSYEYGIDVKFDKMPEGREKDTLPFIVRPMRQLMH